MQLSAPRKCVLLAVTAGGAVAVALGSLARTPRAHLNILQITAAIFFLTVTLRFALRESPGAEEHPQLGGSRLLLLPVLLFPACVYASILGVGFISDDFVHLLDVRRPLATGLSSVLIHGQGDLHFRPLGVASLYLDYRLWHSWVPGYHLTSLLLHLLAVGGVFFFCASLGMEVEVSATAALIFSVLPIQAEAVVWWAARFDVLAASLAIWSAVLYVKFRTSGRAAFYVAALLTFVLALLAKESAYALPVLLLSVELLTRPERRIKPALGFFLLGGLVFAYRWAVFGGIGGYLSEYGRPSALRFGPKSLEGLLLRGPAQMAFGLNWRQPTAGETIAVGSMTAAILLTLAFAVGPERSRRRWILFGLSWAVLANVPVHHLLLIGPGLTNSRVLYLGSVGVAMIVAQLLAGSDHGRRRGRWTVACVVLLTLGLLHNLRAWRWTSEVSRRFLAELIRLEPSPAPKTEFVLYRMPENIRGVFFFHVGLAEAVKAAYDRQDLSARRESTALGGPTFGGQIIRVNWVGDSNKLIERADK